MTLKQLKTIEELPKTGYNMSEAMRRGGYTDASAKAGSQYKSLRRFTSKLDFFDPERIKRDIDMTFKLAKEKEDITNLSRINEHRSKIAGMITDKSETKLALTDERKAELLSLGNRCFGITQDIATG